MESPSLVASGTTTQQMVVLVVVVVVVVVVVSHADGRAEYRLLKAAARLAR